MSSLEQQLSSIKESIRQAEMSRAREEAQVESARAQVKDAVEQLQEMGYSTVAHAKARISELSKQIEDRLEEIRNIL